MEKPRIEPFLLAILAQRFDFITRDMTNTVLRSARSGVVNTGRDFSCAIIDNDCRAISVAVASPSHTGAAGDQIRVLKQLFGDDIKPGDCFINSCSYYGNTHNGDFTVFAPVFFEGDCLFYALSRVHQADIGAPIPSSYLAFSKTIYEEGLQLPCVRIQREYKDLEDLIRMCRIRIRVPDQWYGDYLAQVGAVRTGEKRLIEACEKYGVDTIKSFLDEWQEYGSRRMSEEIGKLPKVVLRAEGAHDPVQGVAPQGIPIKVKMEIFPEEGLIHVDLSENEMPNVAGGFNLTEATVRASTLIGILHNIDPTIPHNEGSFSRIKITAKEGYVVGIPKYPVGTGLATTNVADRLTALIDTLFSKLGYKYGLAEGSTSIVSCPMISGTDWRNGAAPYVNELMLLGGGPGLYGYDGWISYGVAQDSGVLHQDSIEIDEQKYPIIFDKAELMPDSAGDGQWRGAPALQIVMGPRKDAMTVVYFNDQHHFPARGVLGGTNARPTDVLKHNIKTGQVTGLPQISEQRLEPEERIVIYGATGGGYGDPLERDPEMVRYDVREGFISMQRAEEVYGVVLDAGPEQFCVNFDATNELRTKLRRSRSDR